MKPFKILSKIIFILLLFNKLSWSQSQDVLCKINAIRQEMYKLVSQNKLDKIADFYAPHAVVDGYDAKLDGIDEIKNYWQNIRGTGVDWSWEISNISGNESVIFQTGTSHLTLSYGAYQTTYSSLFSVIWEKQDDGEFKLTSDYYRPQGQFRWEIHEYSTDSIWIQTKTDSIFALVFTPKSKTKLKFPAIFCLQGGGNVGIDNYLYEAELFAKAGIVSIVCDKAGAGKSRGSSSWITQTFQAKTDEYTSILNWLCSQPYVDSNMVGIHGPSEGGRLALSVALANSSKIKFVNAVSAPLETLKENQLYAIENLLISQGFSYSTIAQTLNLFNEYFDAIQVKNIPTELIERINKLRTIYPNLYLPLNSTNLPRMPQSEDIAYTFGTDFSSLNCPIFFQYGENDKVVNVQNSIQLIPNQPNIEVKVYKNSDHSINYSNGDINGSYHLDKLKWIFSILQN